LEFAKTSAEDPKASHADNEPDKQDCGNDGHDLYQANEPVECSPKYGNDHAVRVRRGSPTLQSSEENNPHKPLFEA
jgi:hypothetical protein